MGVRLIVEVLDHAPAELTSAERLVLVVLAENANDTTREGWPGMETLTRRTGLSADGVRKAFQRLAVRKLEVRVPLGKDKRGRPVYSAPGKRTTYRIPSFNPDGMAVPPAHLSAGNGGTTVPASAPEWRYSGPEMAVPQSANGGTVVPPIPQQPSGNPQQREGQPSDEERTAILAEIRRRKPGASEGLIRHVYRQDGPAILAEIREHAGRQHIAAWIAALASQPPCEHGQPGGAQLRPDTGDPHCALCRARRRRSAA